MNGVYKVKLKVDVGFAEETKAFDELVHSNSVEILRAGKVLVTEQVVANNSEEAYNKAYKVTDSQLKCGNIYVKGISFHSIEEVS